MKKHYIIFYSPGTLFAETTEIPLDVNWDTKTHKQTAINKAIEKSKSIKERHGAIPYGFRFSTRERKSNEMDSKQIKSSGCYYLPHCKLETLEEIKKRNDPKESILISNMGNCGVKEVVVTTKGWKSTLPFYKDDVLLTDK